MTHPTVDEFSALVGAVRDAGTVEALGAARKLVAVYEALLKDCKTREPNDQDAMCASCAEENGLEHRAGCPTCGKDFL